MTALWQILVLSTSIMIAQPAKAETRGSTNSQPAIEVGILEDVYFGEAFPGSLPPDSVDCYRRIVRVAFLWQGYRWVSYEDTFRKAAEDQNTCFAFWKERHWFLSGSNGNYQEVVSRGQVQVPLKAYFVGQCVVSAPKETKERSLDFAGWPHRPVRPPEVLCTRKPFPDNDRWTEPKPVKFSDLPPHVIKVLQQYLTDEVLKEAPSTETVSESTLQRFVRSASCRNNKERYNVYEIYVDYGENDQNLVDLSKMPIEDPICICDGPKEDGKAWLLGDGLHLFFVGDLNGNGDSELLFWIDRYDQNGYLIANSKLRAAATFEWSYH